MEDVAVLRVGDVAVGAAVGEALEDLARDGARVGGRRAVLRQHHRAARHQRVQDRHLPHPPPAPFLSSPRRRPLPCGLGGEDGGGRKLQEKGRERGRTGWAQLGRDGDGGGHAELADLGAEWGTGREAC